MVEYSCNSLTEDMKMKLCIFDLDGTLTDTLTAIAHFGNAALAANGFSTYPTDRYRAFVGDGRRKLIERMLDAQGALTDANYAAVCAAYDAAYEADPLYKTAAYDGIHAVIAALKADGVSLAVCSNKPDNVVRGVIDRVFAPDTFDLVRGAIDGGAVKPDPALALEIAEKLDASPDECLFIGDTNVDIFTAKNAGMTSVGVLWGFRDRAELESAGADYIIASPAELLQIVSQ